MMDAEEQSPPISHSELSNVASELSPGTELVDQQNEHETLVAERSALSDTSDTDRVTDVGESGSTSLGSEECTRVLDEACRKFNRTRKIIIKNIPPVSYDVSILVSAGKTLKTE